MKLHEVLTIPNVLSGDLWFRPVGFPRGFWYKVKDGDTCYNQSGDAGLSVSAEILSGEWEAVEPNLCLKSSRT